LAGESGAGGDDRRDAGGGGLAVGVRVAAQVPADGQGGAEAGPGPAAGLAVVARDQGDLAAPAGGVEVAAGRKGCATVVQDWVPRVVLD
jgi:hypothetical protein